MFSKAIVSRESVVCDKQQNLASRIPDDVTLLQQLVIQGLIIGTPSFDYDVSIQ
jgi:hypothetical protein